MLNDAIPVTRLPSTDLARARRFYEETLGFAASRVGPDWVQYSAGPGVFAVYESAFAGTNQATALVFLVATDAFDREIADLRARGVAFETFEREGIQWQGDVATVDGGHAVWFRDPDGNILAVGGSPDVGGAATGDSRGS